MEISTNNSCIVLFHFNLLKSWLFPPIGKLKIYFQNHQAWNNCLDVSKMRRIAAFDVFRGLLMIFIILVHPALGRIVATDASQFVDIVNGLPTPVILLLAPIAILALWGTVFVFMTGTTSTYTLASHASKFLNEMAKLKHQLKDRIVNNLLVLMFYYIWTATLVHYSLEHPTQITYSLITGSLEAGSLQIPSILHMLTSSVLEAIAFTGIIVSVIFYLIVKKPSNEGKIPFKKLYSVFLWLAAGVLAVSAILYAIIPDSDIIAIETNLINTQNYLAYYLFMRFVGARFSLFPSLAFGFVGAVLGLILVQNRPIKTIMKRAFQFGVPCIIIFGLFLISGWDPIPAFALEHTPFPWQLFNIGAEVIVIALLLRIFDFNPSGTAHFPRIRTITARYSNNSLTIFIYEAFLTILLYHLFSLLGFQPTLSNMGATTMYLLVIQLMWFFVLRWSAKRDYKWSIEWMIKEIKNKIF